MTPLEAVLNLCIDDGVSSRGHRVNIFKTNYYYTGVATAMHSTYTSETVTTFSGANTPPTYTSPTITVPQTQSAYTGYATWDQPGSCGSGDGPEENAAVKAQAVGGIAIILAFLAMIIVA